METVKIAILGFGTIGSGIAETIERQKMLLTARTNMQFEIAHILDVRDFSLHALSNRFRKSIDDIVNDPEVAVVAEAIGGVNPAFDFVLRCLRAKKHVVTSNKELVATRGSELMQVAADNGVGLLFEAAVGGAMPVVGTMLNALSANRIERIDGILNGTTNYMLTNMWHHAQSFDIALEAAQRRGYAETADPSADIDGIDAQRKIAILASLAYGVAANVNDIETAGIGNVSYEDMHLADLAGGTIKLIASAEGSEFGGIRAAVRPMFVRGESPFYNVSGVYNMVRLKCDLAGDIDVAGRGAGKLPTAGVMVSDIIELVTKETGRRAFWTDAPASAERPEERETAYFFTVCSDKAGELEKLSEKVAPAAKADMGVGFFTGTLSRTDAAELQKQLSKYGFLVKSYAVLED